MAEADDHDHQLALDMYGSCPRCDVLDLAASSANYDRSRIPDPHPDFDGGTYRRGDDRVRLGAQAQRVWDAMGDGAWRTLAELATITRDPEASVSARLRDFRKDGWGGHLVERRHRGPAADGLYEYRVIAAQQTLDAGPVPAP